MLGPIRKPERECGVFFVKGGTDFTGSELARAGRRLEDAETIAQHHGLMGGGSAAGELR
jgi:hypothetical protein